MTNAANTSAVATVATVANDNAQKQRTYPRMVTPKAIKEGSNKNGTPFVSFVGEYTRRGASKPSTMLHTASGKSLESIREQLKEGQPIRVFGVFEKMPATEDRSEGDVFRIIGLSTPRETAQEAAAQTEMEEAA
ncbi:hypothetical protein [Microvirga sp. VF16]|uniref:hypothetical protein n=1 Tax=Microvirga sp. VF16 TaxID=2807101 RepID=UPI00193E3A91|nr:hypothetical protein [Microvirga sp. VF16]QRM34872.1 hypothetical protein JO965_42180 [Microvirga sp. VF16]